MENFKKYIIEKLDTEQDYLTMLAEKVLEEDRLSPDILEELGNCPIEEIEEKILEVYSINPDILEELATYPVEKIRVKVAKRKDLTIEIIEMLCKDEAEKVRYEIAGNPNTPAYILVGLMGDMQDIHNPLSIQTKALSNPNMLLDILKKYAKSTYYYVAESLARNPTTDRETLEKIFYNLQNIQFRYPKLPLDDYRMYDLERLLCIHPNTPDSVLIEFLVEGQQFENQYAYNIAYRKNISGEIFEELLPKTKKLEMLCNILLSNDSLPLKWKEQVEKNLEEIEKDKKE